MNGTQVGDLYRRLSPCREFVNEIVKIVLVSDKEYAVIACDEYGVEDRTASIKHVQRHAFIEKYERMERKT